MAYSLEQGWASQAISRVESSLSLFLKLSSQVESSRERNQVESSRERNQVESSLAKVFYIFFLLIFIKKVYNNFLSVYIYF